MSEATLIINGVQLVPTGEHLNCKAFDFPKANLRILVGDAATVEIEHLDLGDPKLLEGRRISTLVVYGNHKLKTLKLGNIGSSVIRGVSEGSSIAIEGQCMLKSIGLIDTKLEVNSSDVSDLVSMYSNAIITKSEVGTLNLTGLTSFTIENSRIPAIRLVSDSSNHKVNIKNVWAEHNLTFNFSELIGVYDITSGTQFGTIKAERVPVGINYMFTQPNNMLYQFTHAQLRDGAPVVFPSTGKIQTIAHPFNNTSLAELGYRLDLGSFDISEEIKDEIIEQFQEDVHHAAVKHKRAYTAQLSQKVGIF